jgi:hypothetical protein
MLPTDVHTRRRVELVLDQMRRGATLQRAHQSNGTTCWTLSNGRGVTNLVAGAVIARRDVVGIGDSLFDRELSQTFRYVET